MNTRTNQKNRLKSILEAITYNSENLPVFVGVKTDNDRYPFCFITSGGLNPNKDGATLRDRGTYERVREYTIVAVFHITDDIETVNQAERQMDEIEQLIVDKIGDEATRNDAQQWVDIYVTDVSAPISGIELRLEAGMVAKVFTVACETQEAYN
jgi:hypothetical protein